MRLGLWPCSPAKAPECELAGVIACYPEQSESFCAGVVESFVGTLLGGSPVIERHPQVEQAISPRMARQAGRVRVVVPVLHGRARKRGPRRPPLYQPVGAAPRWRFRPGLRPMLELFFACPRPSEYDITDEQQAAYAVKRTVAELGRLDTLIKNAGVMLLGPVVGAPMSEWKRMVQLNALGLLYRAHLEQDGPGKPLRLLGRFRRNNRS